MEKTMNPRFIKNAIAAMFIASGSIVINNLMSQPNEPMKVADARPQSEVADPSAALMLP